MGRPRTPTAILRANGTFDHNKGRYMKEQGRDKEPVPNAPIRKTPPLSLSLDERKVWFEFIRKIPDGVLGDCDEYWLAMAVRMEWKERSRTITGPERSQYITLLGKLGMNPSERSKVTANPSAKPVNADPEDEFLSSVQ